MCFSVGMVYGTYQTLEGTFLTSAKRIGVHQTLEGLQVGLVCCLILATQARKYEIIFYNEIQK